MEQAEIEMLVGELETRMDRLRALYDQYFMGIERLEPLVPRKDVERRMAVLRKEQIRNTGLRYKFQTLTQRFNTYQTYWIRISRQIEQGTYKRDVMRATARFGVDPAKERATEVDTASSPPPSAPRVYIPDEPVEELEDGSAYLIPLDAEDDPFAELNPPPAAREAPRERFASTVKLDLDDLADPFEEHDPFPKPASAGTAPKIRIAQRPQVAASSPPEGEPNRDTERRMPISPVSTPLRIAPRAGASGAAPASGEPKIVISKRASIPDEAERRAVAAPVAGASAPAPPPSRPSLQRPGTLSGAGPALGPSARPAAPPPATGAPPRVTLQRPGTLPSAAPASTPQKPGPAAALPAPAAAASRSPPPRPPAASAPTIPRAAPAGPSKISDPPGPAPARSAPPRAAAAARPAPARAAAPAPAPSRIGDLSGDRFGQIYSKYVETRRAHNEPTHAITREALAKQLSDSTERLKQKHGGKPIDFEVVVKDGKTILRPVVK